MTNQSEETKLALVDLRMKNFEISQGKTDAKVDLILSKLDKDYVTKEQHLSDINALKGNIWLRTYAIPALMYIIGGLTLFLVESYLKSVR